MFAFTRFLVLTNAPSQSSTYTIAPIGGQVALGLGADVYMMDLRGTGTTKPLVVRISATSQNVSVTAHIQRLPPSGLFFDSGPGSSDAIQRSRQVGTMH
jgi:hypothetical protein